MKLTLIFLLVAAFAFVQAHPTREQGNTHLQGRSLCGCLCIPDCCCPCLPCACRRTPDQNPCCTPCGRGNVEINSVDNAYIDNTGDCPCACDDNDDSDAENTTRGTVNANTIHQADINNQDFDCRPNNNRGNIPIPQQA